MKVEVGMYVRTLFGIRQISKINTGKDKTYWGGIILDKPYKGSKAISNNNILKSSFNIIDLVELNDYVNGHLIDYIDKECRFLRSERPYRENTSDYKSLIEKGRDYNQCLHFLNEDIKTIVTNEQLAEIEYRVEEIV